MGNRYGAGNPAYDGLNRLTQFGGAPILHDLLGNRLQDGRHLYQWDPLNRLVGMQAYQASGRFKVLGDWWRFAYRADGLRVVKENVSQLVATDNGEVGGSLRTEYLYDGQMPVCEQEFVGSTLRTTRVNFLGARGIEAVLTIDHTRGNQASLAWLLYDGHGNLVRMMSPDYRLSGFQWRGVWGEVQSSLGTGRGYCANLGHPEDETGLVYMRARYYEPATGRFISEDPVRDGVNWYLYADGNPVEKVDPSGEFGLIIGQIAGERVRADLEVSGAVAAQAAKDAALRGLLDAWTRWVLKTIVYGAEALGPGEYTIASGIGTWIIRYVIGRDPSGSAFAIQVWLQNNGTRFMGIFASKSGQFYNIDIKFADSRFIWWVQQLLGGF